MQITFWGAAGEVTGSCHQLEVGGRTLLVDCGLIQGGRDAPARNREPFPFDPLGIDALVLTHAHIDHCGRLPLLVKRGFRGPVFASEACRELLPILLRDSVSLARREALPPLYQIADVERALERVRTLRYDTEYTPIPGVTLRLREAGHILGSASLELSCREAEHTRTVVFSGDLGPYDSPILLDPHRFESADLVVMESTYGDRCHRNRTETVREFGEILAEASRDGGNVVVPAFAVGRSQELLYQLGAHFKEWQLHRWKVFLDSPMAIEASRVYWNHPERYDAEARRLRSGFERMPALPNLALCRTPEESRAISSQVSHAIIIAGSGMCNGGRILGHLARHLSRSECHIVITGFQAPGTLGRRLVDRQPEVRIHGRDIRVAAKVHTLGGLSAHADQADLLRWYGNFVGQPAVRLVHGEPAAADALRQKLAAQGVQVQVPQRGERVDLLGV